MHLKGFVPALKDGQQAWEMHEQRPILALPLLSVFSLLPGWVYIACGTAAFRAAAQHSHGR